MSRLEELIAELCPAGVEYKTLGELGSFYGGITGKSKDDFINGNAKFITYKNVYSNLALKLDVEDRVKISPNEKQRTLEYGDVIFTGSSETPDECGFSSVLTKKTDEKLYLNSFCFFFRFHDKELMLPDFSKYLFRSTNVRYQVGKTANGVTRFNVSKKLMEKVCIPIPPLPVQGEIVRILDNFTELTAELTARKKQYEYYRDRLLSHDIHARVGKLIDMLERPITDGPHTTPQLVSSGIPFLSAESIYDGQIHFEKKRGYITEQFDDECCKKYKPQKNDVFMVKSGSTTGKVGYVDTDDRFNIWSPIATMRVNADNSSRFLFHLLQSEKVQK